MAVSEQDVRHVAALARLGLDEARLPSLVTELNGILAHMELLQQVPIAEGALAPDAASGLRMREDVVQPVPFATPRESFAPLMRDGFFLVPRLATHGAAGQSAAGRSADDAGDDA
ncbi:MAG: aspartyl/glutamyl-tRNA amidotransferase subunit C [Gemmatimonadaceae bacterium]|jgi:aspartyl-tRNA(Asn)/glutamyl-tRNA(Gln) amidotransferase subunit C|nr:aspartyl/glutamyl-tRNA amidotransferase subunit C [Gemmatimonadaceae bacterium]